MTPASLSAARRRLARISLGVVLAGTSLAPASPAGATELPGPLPASDPDAARGFDDANWAPKPGSVRVVTLPSNLASVPLDMPPGFSAQAADGDFHWQGRTTNLFVYCVRPAERDRKKVDLKACFKARRFDEERDEQGHEYVGEGFKVFASGKDGWRLDRVKGRAEQPSGRAVDWGPSADEEHGNPSTVTVSAGWNGFGMSASWNLYPGRMHPWVGSRLFHSSWINQADGAPSGYSVASVGVAVWQMRRSERVRADTGMAEVWLIK
ncbi:MAG: hypothetical protein ACRDY7_06325 [Acidimicrobiia bacterium]